MAPPREFALRKERKWELVSAFQKSIRRGDKVMALRLASAMDSVPEEYAYFWRRLCVIACEDVGPADDVLASFVVACATVFPPKKTGSENYKVFCFLAEQMCDLVNRSRIYCSYGIIEPAITSCQLPELTPDDKPILEAIAQRKAMVQGAETSLRAWQSKNDWRAEGLLRFLDLTIPFQILQVNTQMPLHKMLFDLPSYCYDMHTRVGLEMLRRLVRGVVGAECIKEFFRHNKVEGAHRALGEALFFVEGGRIRGELIYEPLCSLEQRLFAYQHGLPMDKWLHLRDLAEKALREGIIDQVRDEVLQRYYGQGILQFDCQRGCVMGNASN